MSRYVPWDEVYERLKGMPPGKLFGIPRGGAIIAGLTGRAVDCPEEADWVVDVIDGSSPAGAVTTSTEKPLWAMFDRRIDKLGDTKIVFPWDHPAAVGGRDPLERIANELLLELGYDVSQPGLVGTPGRWARWWREFHAFDPGNTDVAFDVVTTSQLVLVTGIKVWSLCEHHLLPFHAEVSIAYCPHGRAIGLSKFARLAHQAAHRLQLQERLTEEIAGAVERIGGSGDVAVLLRGRHLCMEARGVRSAARTDSFVTRGAFTQDLGLRADVLQLVGRAPELLE